MADMEISSVASSETLTDNEAYYSNQGWELTAAPEHQRVRDWMRHQQRIEREVLEG